MYVSQDTDCMLALSLHEVLLKMEKGLVHLNFIFLIGNL